MRRYVRTSEDEAERYRVVDDTISTWAVEDTEDGSIVDKGITKLQAETRAKEYNESEVDLSFDE